LREKGKNRPYEKIRNTLDITKERGSLAVFKIGESEKKKKHNGPRDLEDRESGKARGGEKPWYNFIERKERGSLGMRTRSRGTIIYT